MIPDSLTLNSTRFAFVMPIQPAMKREDNLDYYDRITAAQIDLPDFSQSSNALVLTRRTGDKPPNMVQLTVDHHGEHFRYFILEDFPRKSFEVFKKEADICWEKLQEVWSLERLGGRPILAEVTLRLIADVENHDATTYLTNKTLKISQHALSLLDRKIQGVGLRLVFPIQVSSDVSQVPIPGADGNLLIETLLEDPSRLYFQMTAKWPSFALPVEAEKDGLPPYLNPEVRKPSEYLEDVYSFIQDHVIPFLMDRSD